MNRLFERIGFVMTSMGAVILVLVTTLLGLITFTHTLFNEVLPTTFTGWERTLACWLLALGWEFTLLITTCNTQFLNRRIPVIVAIASGVIVLFFIQAFDSHAPLIELSKRWFIGVLVATINYIYTELFYAKWQEIQQRRDQSKRISELEAILYETTLNLTKAQESLSVTIKDNERLTDYVIELEAYKKAELDKLKCPYCHSQFETVYKLASHKGVCEKRPNKSRKESIFDLVNR